MRYLIAPVFFFAMGIRATPVQAALPDAVQRCQQAGHQMLEQQVGTIKNLTLRVASTAIPRTHLERHRTLVDGIGRAEAEHGSLQFAFRCVVNEGTGKSEFTYNNMQMHSPLGLAVIDERSAAGAPVSE